MELPPPDFIDQAESVSHELDEVSAERAEELKDKIHHDLDRSHEGFGVLISQIAEAIEEGKYSSVLIDQRGGALPAIVVGGLMQRRARDTGMPEPNVIDLPGGKWWHRIDKEAYIDSVRPLVGERALVVTEAIAGGERSGAIYASLIKGGIPLDVAAFQTYFDETEYKSDEQRWGRHGKILDDLTLYSGAPKGSDDILNTPALVVARGIEEDPAQFAPLQSYTAPEQEIMIAAAREHLEWLTDYLYADYFQ